MDIWTPPTPVRLHSAAGHHDVVLYLQRVRTGLLHIDTDNSLIYSTCIDDSLLLFVFAREHMSSETGKLWREREKSPTG